MELFPVSFLLLILLLGSSLFIFLRRRSTSSSPVNSTVLKSYPLLGNIPQLIRNSHRILDWSTELLLLPSSPASAGAGATVTVAPLVFTANPANVEHMSKARFDNYPKCESIISSIRDCLGHGIANTNGEEWRLQRKDASHEFNAKSLRAFIIDRVRHELTGRLLPLLAEAARSGSVLDLQELLERFAFDNMCSLVLDQDPKCLGGGSEEGERFFRAFDEATRLSVERAKQPLPLIWKIKKWLNAGSERRLRESMAIVHDFIDKCLKSRRKQWSDGKGSLTGAGANDFLSRFASDGTYSDEYIRDILVGFLLAGVDTTPSALTWFFWVLSSRGEIVDKIRKEIKLIRSRRAENGEDEGAEALTMHQLRDMSYLHAALSETLRLYPIVPLVPRECLAEDELPDGTRVRKGWTLMYNAYAMGRTEAIWGPDCREFRPVRWLDNREEEGSFRPRSAFEFPAFHSGPRMCMGREMAYVQMKAVAASILERFEVEVVAERGRHELLMSMRMEGGLPVRVKEIA